jgi:hypothetical protein
MKAMLVPVGSNELFGGPLLERAALIFFLV